MAKKGRPRKSEEGAIVRSAELLGWALGGVEREIDHTRARLTALTQEASRMRAQLAKRGRLGLERVAASVPKPRRRRSMSAAAKRRLSQIMKKRWAERKRRAKS